MKPLTIAFRMIILFAMLSFIFIRANGQDFKWQKDVKGHLYTAKPSSNAKINSVFDLVNRIPVIAHPKGFDVQEWYHVSTNENPYPVHLYVNFYDYYSYQNGQVQRSEAHVPTVTISVNDPGLLMNDQNFLFHEQTEALHMPVMFTDTFPISYQAMNGYRVGQGVNTQFGRPVKIFVLNPRNIRFFRPVTTEEYLKVFIKKLSGDIDEHTKGLVESKKTIAEFEKNEQLKNSLDVLKQTQSGMIKWVAFLRSKKEYYEKKLASLSDKERKAPAVYAMYKKQAVMMDKNGNNLDEISGSLPYAPLESTEDTLATAALFTFNEKSFDPRLPKNSFQLMVISDAFQTDDDREMKKFFDKQLYPSFPFKELADLMYK
jgi:hypothetical protein